MNETWIIILSIGYFIATLSLIAAIVFLIVVAIELRRGVNAFKELLNFTKSRLEPTIAETERVMKGVKATVDDINEVSLRVRELSKTVEQLTTIVLELISMVERAKGSLAVRGNALRAALAVAANVFLENLKKGGKKDG